MKPSLSCFALLCILLCQPLLAAELNLQGLWHFALGDEPVWSQTEFDHADWRTVEVPGALLPQLKESPQSIGWYRHRFDWKTEDPETELALFLGPIHEADEVFLNGRLIGRTGLIGDGLGSTVAAYRSPRLYPVPANLLADGENVLAVRIQVLGTAGGMVSGPALLGPAETLRPLKDQQEQWAIVSQSAIVAVLIATALISAFIAYWAGRDRAEHAWFFVFVLTAGLVLGIESLPFYLSGAKSPAVQLLAYCLSYFAPIAFNRYIHKVFGQPFTWLPKALELSLLIMTVSVVAGPPGWLQWTNLGWVLAITIILLWALKMAWQAMQRSVAGAKIWLLNLTLLWLFLGVLVFTGTPGNSALRVDELALSIFILGVLLAHARRFQAFGYRYQNLSARLVDSVEDERKRLSQEIHDGIGQSLAAIKLRLGMLKTQPDDTELGEIRDELGGAIDELRSVVRGMHPLSFQHLDFNNAVHALCERLQHRQQMTVNLAPPSNPLSDEAKRHLLRMIQECINNAHQHGEASIIEISGRQDGPEYMLTIKDNGKGMDEIPAEGINGIGLISLNERAELLRGRIRIQSKPGAGTTIEFRGPLSALSQSQ